MLDLSSPVARDQEGFHFFYKDLCQAKFVTLR